MKYDFQQTLKEALDAFLRSQQSKFPLNETLKTDLHCHDLNSNVPDELIGRILDVPETWLPSTKLIKSLQENACDAFTITNHNNARSCYELQDKGFDILTAAEFSCMEPDFGVGIHVLTYGFTPEQEVRLEKLRKNVYAFQQYARANDIPTIWAHPLYHYSVKKTPPEAFFNKMLLIFERFEALNGQRDTWQNMLVKEWIERVSPAVIDQYAKTYQINPLDFCADPCHKSLSGGSDCHMGLFAGMTGTYLHVPGLRERLKTESRSQLALEAIRRGDMAPFGAYQNTQKMTIALLNYACQIALNYKDPGLLRLVLHKGSVNDKIISMLASNLFLEVQKHKVTHSFIKIFLDSMKGESPSPLKKLILKPVYKPIFDEAVRIAQKKRENSVDLVNGYYDSIVKINDQFHSILAKRIEKKLQHQNIEKQVKNISLESFIEKLELPTNIRKYTEPSEKGEKDSFNISEFLDGLSFPFFGSMFILSAHFASAKTMFHSRRLLNDFSKRLDCFEHPGRVLWLTDTFGDNNGVSMALKEMHEEIKRKNLPVDIVTCSSGIESDDHLVVLKPVKEFSLPVYPDYRFKVPNLLELHNLFFDGGYDRTVCSTEGIMGLFGLYLKHAYTVEASFYMHTDWLMFARKMLHIEGHNLNRVRRLLRSFYQGFDRVFVLNSDQKAWLSGTQMNIRPEKVHQTAHWVNNCFKPCHPDKKKLFGTEDDEPVLLYAGRVSPEKGVLELPAIYKGIRERHVKARMVIVGKGPALETLRKEIPGGIFLDWVEQSKLPEIYASADILILPSRFDTFCNVVLEALSCGLPVVAYKTKGPKDIIQHGKNGFLADTKQEIQERVIEYLDSNYKKAFKQSAIKRAKDYNADTIMSDLMRSIGLDNAR